MTDFFGGRECDAAVQKLVIEGTRKLMNTSISICVPSNKADGDVIAGCDDPKAIADAMPRDFIRVFDEFRLSANVLKIMNGDNLRKKKLVIVLGSPRVGGAEPVAQQRCYAIEFVI